MLQGVPHEFDRVGLETWINYQREDGASKPGVRCATRPVADFERQFIGSAVEEHLRSAGTGHRTGRSASHRRLHQHLRMQPDRDGR